MRVITWNIHGANKESLAWKLLLELQPDLVLLQEVGSLPDEIKSVFKVLSKVAIYKTGRPQKFSTAVLVKGKIIKEISLKSEYAWVNRELEFFKGNFISCIVQPLQQRPFNVVSVYSPAWPLDEVWALRGRCPSDTEISQIKLKLNPKVWPTEVIWSALKNTISNNEQWVVGGDYNSSETFDKDWPGGSPGLVSDGNKEVFNRMNDLGFTECLSKFNGKLIPTFQNATDKKVIHQVDHLFVTNTIYSKLNECGVGNQSIIFGKPSLSDHLPIIADFRG